MHMDATCAIDEEMHSVSFWLAGRDMMKVKVAQSAVKS